LIASLCEFVIMVEGTSMLAAGGPPIVKAAIGRDVGKDELGGPDVHCRISGVADDAAKDEADAMAMAKHFLSYLPNNAFEYPPHMPCDDPVDRADESLLSILPENPRASYDMKEIIAAVMDQASFFEIKPAHAPMLITGFARMDGHPVGVLANQPKVMAGTITEKAARKARHFIDLCNAYHVPLIFLQDVPGVMPGPESEREGILRAGLAITYSLAWADVPKITIVIHKAFGYGSCAMCGGGAGQTVILAWPSADFGSLPPESAILAAHGREIETATDPEATKQELLDNYRKSAGAFHAAGIFTIDDVIDPRETRLRIIRALELARQRRSAPAQPSPRYGVMP
jgi:acetyl-CoA carboxylase carboxyltransferase component